MKRDVGGGGGGWGVNSTELLTYVLGLRYFSSGVEKFSGGGGGSEIFGVRNFLGGVEKFQGGGVQIFSGGIEIFSGGVWNFSGGVNTFL